MKSNNEFYHSSSCSSEYEFLVSTCQTTEAVHLCKKDGMDVYAKRVSKTERIYAASLKEASKKFETTDSYILFSAKNKDYLTFKFYISPDRRLHRFIDTPDEILEVYNHYGVSLLDYLLKHYELSLEDNTTPSSIFFDYFLQEKEELLPPDVKRLEKHIIDNCSEETRKKYNLLTEGVYAAPESQYRVAEILRRAALEERDKNRPILNFDYRCPVSSVTKAYYSPALAWALKAIESHYPPAYYLAAILIGQSWSEIKNSHLLEVTLVVHAAFLGDTDAQIALARDNATDSKSPELPYLVEYNPEYAKFWFEILIKKDDPKAYDSIALFYYRILNKDLHMANVYYQKLVNAGNEEVYGDLISGLIYEESFDSACNALDELLKTDNVQALKEAFQRLNSCDTYKKLSKRNVQYELSNRIVQLTNDIQYYPYLAEYYYSKGDTSAYKRYIHAILGSSDVKAISQAYNVFRKNLFLSMKDTSLEIELLNEAGRLGNPKATTILQKGYKKGLFGGWKHTRDWTYYNL